MQAKDPPFYWSSRVREVDLTVETVNISSGKCELGAIKESEEFLCAWNIYVQKRRENYCPRYALAFGNESRYNFFPWAMYDGGEPHMIYLLLLWPVNKFPSHNEDIHRDARRRRRLVRLFLLLCAFPLTFTNNLPPEQAVVEKGWVCNLLTILSWTKCASSEVVCVMVCLYIPRTKITQSQHL